MTNKQKVLLLLPILSVLLTACTLRDLPVIGQYLPGGNEPEPIESRSANLNIWGLWEDPSVMSSLIEQYKADKPNINLTYNDRSVMTLIEYKERVSSRIQGDAEIDIYMVHNSWVNRFSPYLSSMPSNYMTPDNYRSLYYPVVASSGVFNNEIKAIPVYYDGLVLLYNKNHLQTVGQIVPPTGWEEFRRLAIDLTIRGGEGGRTLIRGGAAMGTADNISHFSDIIGLLWSQAGSAIPQEVDSISAQDAFTYYVNYATEDQVWDNSMPLDTQAFVEEKVSMIFVPSWQVLGILERMPNIEDVGVAPVPQAIKDKPATWATFWMFVVPENSPNKDIAWDFLNFYRQESTQLAYYNAASKVRAFGPPFALTSLAGEVTNPYISTTLSSAPYANSAEIAQQSGNRRQVDSLRDAVNSLLNRQSTAEAVLQTVKQELSQ